MIRQSQKLSGGIPVQSKKKTLSFQFFLCWYQTDNIHEYVFFGLSLAWIRNVFLVKGHQDEADVTIFVQLYHLWRNHT